MPNVTKQTTKPRKRKKGGKVVDRIQPIGFDKKDGIKINLYGRSGTGKTTLWATFPKPILAVVCSGGSQPGELRSINTPAYRKTINQVVIESSEEIKELVEYQKETNKYATIVLDHATGLQDYVLREVLGIDQAPAQLSWGVASQQQYGQVALQMKERLRSLLDLDCNVVIVAQEREFNTDSEGDLLMPFVGSALTPSVTGWLNPACDYICQTFIRQVSEQVTIKVGNKEVKKSRKGAGVEYCLRTAPDPVFITKFRLPKGVDLPDVIVDPDFDNINQLITGQGG